MVECARGGGGIREARRWRLGSLSSLPGRRAADTIEGQILFEGIWTTAAGKTGCLLSAQGGTAMDQQRKELLERFTALMRQRLTENTHRPGWRELPPWHLAARALANLADAHDLAAGDDLRRVRTHVLAALADCANYCAMFADSLGFLDESTRQDS